MDKFKFPVLIMSSALAETLASWALCPLEVAKIYMISNSGSSGSLIGAISAITKSEGIRGLYKGINWILLRQIPYTCVKLVGYDVIATHLRSKLIREPNINSTQRSKSSVHSLSEFIPIATCIQLSSGVAAGVLAAFVSQPADVLLSKICGATLASGSVKECIICNGPSTMLDMIRELGLSGCYKGIQPRAIMVGSITALQFLVYENAKSIIRKADNDMQKKSS